MRNRFFLMRHGESQANTAGLIISDPEVGCRLYGLTRKGREDAKLAAQNSGLDEHTVIVASDFLRTKETAKIAADALACDAPRWEPGLRERFFGKLEGTANGGYEKVWEHDNLDSLNTLFGAESPLHLGHRVTRVLERLDAEWEDKNILLVSHGDTLRFLQLAAAGRDLTEHMQVRHFAPAEIRSLGELPEAL